MYHGRNVKAPPREEATARCSLRNSQDQAQLASHFNSMADVEHGMNDTPQIASLQRRASWRHSAHGQHAPSTRLRHYHHHSIPRRNPLEHITPIKTLATFHNVTFPPAIGLKSTRAMSAVPQPRMAQGIPRVVQVIGYFP